MGRTCKVEGCNVREGQGKKLFRFPKDPERRAVWVSRTGRRFWQPKASSCVCEDHFDITQWETVREDGSKVLRHCAIPLPVENNENICLITHDHGYAVSACQRHPFRDLTTQVNRLPHDHGYASIQSSKSILVAESQVIARPSNIAVESIPHHVVNQDLTSSLSHNISVMFNVMDYSKEIDHESSSGFSTVNCNSDDLEPLSILADVCAASEPILSIKKSKSSMIQELHDQLKKQKEEIEVLQHNNKLLNIITQKVTKKFNTLKSTYNKCRLRFLREQSKAKFPLILKSRLRADQIEALRRKSNRGFKWSSESIKDALMFKTMWGTTSFTNFVNYLPIFPSARTLQRAVEHIQFESGILDEVFNMLKPALD
ncbi:uncharacterized protein LOC118644926 [Monomorium pharaonis]|uniref:uncharacterized protein LOC118644926 n=1 Tax=Monomorium pharaonis TaxID=307658 RepID=UPI001745F957|nr:uncharacterized protein LOC118644926 [Monomorium pharaonis]